jgi:hypothetical protein
MSTMQIFQSFELESNGRDSAFAKVLEGLHGGVVIERV